MRSNFKLIFEDDKSLNKFAIYFHNYLSQNKCWLKNCDYHSIKNNLFVYTNNYTYIDNFISNNSEKYNYNIIKFYMKNIRRINYGIKTLNILP